MTAGNSDLCRLMNARSHAHEDRDWILPVSLRSGPESGASPAGFARMASRACPTSGRAAIHSSNVMSAPVRCAASRYAVKAISRQ